MEITFERLLDLINGGNWGLSSAFAAPRPIKSACLSGADIAIVGGDGSELCRLATEGAEIKASHPCEGVGPVTELILYAPALRREQRKKIDGGGFREIPYMKPIVRFHHIPTWEAMMKLAADRHAAEEAARKEAAARAKAERKAAEDRQRQEARQRTLDHLAALTVKHAGAILKGFRLQENLSVAIELDDGRIIPFDVDHNDDCYYGCNLSVADHAIK